MLIAFPFLLVSVCADSRDVMVLLIRPFFAFFGVLTLILSLRLLANYDSIGVFLGETELVDSLDPPTVRIPYSSISRAIWTPNAEAIVIEFLNSDQKHEIALSAFEGEKDIFEFLRLLDLFRFRPENLPLEEILYK